MAYDRDEWRTPWRTDEPLRGSSRAPAAPDPSTRLDRDERGAVRTVRDGHDTDPAHGAAPSDETASVDTARVDRPNDPADRTAAAAAAAVPVIARFPQPPPSSFDASASGPGSPVGSVRPPDTTGTHDAPPKRARRSGVLLVGLVAGLVGALIGGGIVAAVVSPGEQPIATDAPNSAPSINVDGETSSIVPAVAEAVTPSVVRIDVRGGQGGPDAGPFGDALGSGVIYRSDGYVITNNHVIGDADTVEVRLASGDVHDAEVVGTDPLNDLAVIRLDRTGLPAINVREVDDALVVGETVVAIGSPFGLDASVTTGIISGLNRDLQVPDEEGVVNSIPAVIQTDAAINPGNSGGALVDAQGNLIGINTAILSRTGGNQGVGFAVPAEQAVTSADQIIDQGFVRHPLLGITGGDIGPDVAEQFGLDAARGAIVEDIQDGTGAAEAGVQPGDLITEVDGEQLATMAQLVAEVRSRQPGDVVELTIVRDGEEIQVEVTLSERPR